jgi:glycerol uptake facilitator protein
MRDKPCLLGECVAELIGTFILVFFGTGSVAAAVLTGAQQGLWQVAVVWGFAISLAIYATSAVSGTHINPAVTVSMAVLRPRDFPARKIAPYVLSQVLGGVLASLVLLSLFSGICVHFEAAHNLVRGDPGSQLSAMWFGEYFPNPAILGTDAPAFRAVSTANAFAAEAVGTAFLLFFVFALTDRRNPNAPSGPSNLYAYFIGFTVAIVISIVAPLTQAGLNPARDFAPRIVAYFAGWGSIAIPGPRGSEWWLYILAPIVGGLVGATIYDSLVRRFLPAPQAAPEIRIA